MQTNSMNVNWIFTLMKDGGGKDVFKDSTSACSNKIKQPWPGVLVSLTVQRITHDSQKSRFSKVSLAPATCPRPTNTGNSAFPWGLPPLSLLWTQQYKDVFSLPFWTER